MSQAIQLDARRSVQEAQPAESGAAVMIQMIQRCAADPAVDVDKMERMMTMHERIVDRSAAAAFNAAMVRAQGRIKPVVRDSLNTHTNSYFANLEAIDRQATPIYTAEGLALSFGTEDSALAGHVRVVCDVMHELGHVKRYKVDLPLDGAGARGNANKTGVQAHGSTYSYARRYLTVLIFNVTIVNEDNDGNYTDPEPQQASAQAAQQDQQSAEPGIEYFPADRFAKNLPSYQQMIESGEHDAEYIAGMLKLKYPLTDEQLATLRAFKPQSQPQQVAQ